MKDNKNIKVFCTWFVAGIEPTGCDLLYVLYGNL